MKGKRLKYSKQAETILNTIKEGTFDIDAFEKWIEETKFIVGGGYIIEYLELIQRKNDMGRNKVTR